MEKLNKTMGSAYNHDQQEFGNLPGKICLKIRKEMFAAWLKLANPSPEIIVLDVGVTCDDREDSNFFEKLYPYPHKITAIGIEDCTFLENNYPGLKFLKADGRKLPFEDKSFDLAVSFATIEHVGNRQRQKEFIYELSRVSRQCCFTTPNRWHPLKFHTVLPLIHWLPPRMFRSILRCLGKSFFAQENLLTKKDILSILPPNKEVQIKYFRLFGIVSNLMVYIKDC